MVSIAETVGRVQVQDIEGQEQPAEVGGGSFVSLGNGVEVNPVTVEARREVLPSEVEPQMFTNGHTCRVLCDRPEDSIKADAYAYVFITARAEGDRMFLVANAHEWRHARRQDMPCKSLGVSAGVEMRVEAAALRNPGGCVVEMND